MIVNVLFLVATATTAGVSANMQHRFVSPINQHNGINKSNPLYASRQANQHLRVGQTSSRHSALELPTSLSEPCTALIMDVQNEGPDGGGAEGGMYLACETPMGLTYSISSALVTSDWIDEKVQSGALISGATMLDIPIGTLIDSITQSLLLVVPPVLINGRRRNLAVVRGDRTVLAVKVVVDGTCSVFLHSPVL